MTYHPSQSDLLNFVSMCSQPIDTMRRAGMNDALIACVLTEVRSIALNAEFLRVRTLLTSNPPTHIPWSVVMDAIEEHRHA